MLDQHPVARQAAHGEAAVAIPPGGAKGRARPARLAAHIDAGLEADQILDVFHQIVLDLFGGDDADRGRDIGRIGGGARCGDGDHRRSFGICCGRCIGGATCAETGRGKGGGEAACGEKAAQRDGAKHGMQILVTNDSQEH